MYPSEKLIGEAENWDIKVYSYSFAGKFKGIYYNGAIFIDPKLTEREKHCILAEELGHAILNDGNILNQENMCNIKQERIARVYAYKTLVTVDKMLQAYQAGCRNAYEIAEYLDVTEKFFNDAIAYYRQKYGSMMSVEGFTVYFNDCGFSCIKDDDI